MTVRREAIFVSDSATLRGAAEGTRQQGGDVVKDAGVPAFDAAEGTGRDDSANGTSLLEYQ